MSVLMFAFTFDIHKRIREPKGKSVMHSALRDSRVKRILFWGMSETSWKSDFQVCHLLHCYMRNPHHCVLLAALLRYHRIPRLLPRPATRNCISSGTTWPPQQQLLFHHVRCWATATSSATPKTPCGFTQDKLVELKKDIKKRELDYEDYFFKATQRGVGDTDLLARTFSIARTDIYDRCKDCGCTISEHQAALPNGGISTTTTNFKTTRIQLPSFDPSTHDFTLYLNSHQQQGLRAVL